jgi:hypothetical protein
VWVGAGGVSMEGERQDAGGRGGVGCWSVPTTSMESERHWRGAEQAGDA